MKELVWMPEPFAAADSVELRHDNGYKVFGYKSTYHGRDCYRFPLPDSVPDGQGCAVITYFPFETRDLHGILILGPHPYFPDLTAYYIVDTIRQTGGSNRTPPLRPLGQFLAQEIP